MYSFFSAAHPSKARNALQAKVPTTDNKYCFLDLAFREWLIFSEEVCSVCRFAQCEQVLISRYVEPSVMFCAANLR